MADIFLNQHPSNGYCLCGWPLLADGTCADAECSFGWQTPLEEYEAAMKEETAGG